MFRKAIIVVLTLFTLATGGGLFLNSTLGGCKCVRYSWITPDGWYNKIEAATISKAT